MSIADRAGRPARLAAALGLGLGLALGIAAAPLHGQSPDALRLKALVEGLTVTPRVLFVTLRPGDENLPLITWLSRGHHVQTGVLALTRGESSPNYAGMETGVALGAIHVQEALAARRVDGAEQFFTRDYDFGYARDTVDVFKQWNRDSLVADVVTVIRSFRPHVIVAEYAPGTAALDPELAALASVVREAFDAANDARRFPFGQFGPGWRPAKLYRYGSGLRIATDQYDPALGGSYADLSVDARAQYRTRGLANISPPLRTAIDLALLEPARPDTAPAERSIFDGVDTTFMRLGAYAPLSVVNALPAMAAYADSARRAFDARDLSATVAPLARFAQLATSVRGELAWCKHAALSAQPLVVPGRSCSLNTLDLDAAIDRIRQRATTALLAAAGVTIDATADRELVARSDTGVVMVTIANHGTRPVSVRDVSVWGSMARDSAPRVIPPDSTAHVFRAVSDLASPHPWWIQNRSEGRFPDFPSAADGLDRDMIIPSNLRVPAIAVPENIRRTSDATVTLTIDSATVSTSLGPIVFPYADPVVGVQRRGIAGVPDVSLRFERGLQWIPEHAVVKRNLRLFVSSASDHERSFVPKPFVPEGVTLDSAPKLVSLAPHEARDMAVRMRARMDATVRRDFGLAGVVSPSVAYISGIRTIQYPYLSPIRLEGSSGFWLQAVDVRVPPGVVVGYVGLNDDVASALEDIGVPLAIIKPDDLLYADLSKVNTLLFGPRAFEMHPQLFAQSGRILDFARGGGTVVVMRGEYATVQSRVLPYPATTTRPVPTHVTQPDAAVSVLSPRSRLLSWPNAIGAADWKGWVSGRALFVPTTVDPHYTRVIGLADPGVSPNNNSILYTKFGQGAFVYTALTLEQQIDGGVPGALRLLVNLLSAGQAERTAAAAGR
ncbi:MAG TPA: PIG-L family deacetylase [Gemmatimonadaceae bacterium]|nr:PIG-L family deacetylase [Gemmatimonadaceae bacterium]